MPDSSEKPSRIRFDGTVNAGHILTFAGFLITIFVGWTALDKRVVVLEEGRLTQRQVDLHQNEMTRSEMTQIKDSLVEIKRSVERVNDQLRGIKP